MHFSLNADNRLEVLNIDKSQTNLSGLNSSVISCEIENIDSMVNALMMANNRNSDLAGFELSESISGNNPPMVPTKISQGASSKSIN